jgi:hypothetical protein
MVSGELCVEDVMEMAIKNGRARHQDMSRSAALEAEHGYWAGRQGGFMQLDATITGFTSCRDRMLWG